MLKSLLPIVLVAMPLCGSTSADLISGSVLSSLGEQIYRQGIGADGSAIEASLAGGVSVDGKLFACANCHQRSGMGSVEGSVVAWPLAGRFLYEPRRRTGAWQPDKTKKISNGHKGRPDRLPEHFQAAHARPAFTRETLAETIRTGRLPNRDLLSRAMPRYQLEGRDMDALINYLDELSSEPDPGVTESTIRFATVVSDDVPATERQAMLGVLQAIARAHSVQTRPHKRRARYGPFYKTQSYGAYRQMELDIWELRGPAETWTEQLQSYYLTQPVFALLGGMVEGPWKPIHEFSERMELPTIFPITNQPVMEGNGWYTLYMSKGYAQEGVTAARYLSRNDGMEKPVRHVVHVYRSGMNGQTIVDSFDQEWKSLTKQSVSHIAQQQMKPSSAEQALLIDLLMDIPEEESSAVMFWLDDNELSHWLSVIEQNLTSQMQLVASSSLLRKPVTLLPDSLKGRFLFTQPIATEAENQSRYRAVRQWLRIRNIPEIEIDIQARMYFLGWLMPGVLKSMRGEYLRDFFLESFDMMSDQNTAIAVYPEVTFGSGQRFAAKGCYMARLEESSTGDGSELVPVSSWVIH